MFGLCRIFRINQRKACRKISTMNKHLFNVVQLAIGFLFVFSAFNSSGFIQETVINNVAKNGTIDKHDGYISLSIIYLVLTFANLVAAPIVAILNPKWAIVFGGVTYAIFQAGFLFLNKIFLYLSSALLGLGAAVIWTAQGNYLSLNSTDYTAGKNSGIFWAISQACLIFGGIFMFFVFNSEDSQEITHSTVLILYGVFTAVTVVGIVIFAFLQLPTVGSFQISTPNEAGENLASSSVGGPSDLSASSQRQPLSVGEIIVGTIKLGSTKRMLFMILAFCYTGIELSFWSGIYPTCISSTRKLGYNTNSLLALNAIMQGIGQAVSGFLFGILSSKTRRIGRYRIVMLGSFIHLLVFAAVFINFPADASLGQTDEIGVIHPSIAIALACGFWLGFGDACWNTQIYAFLITRCSKQSAEAFSLFKFFQSLFTCAAFYYSKNVPLYWHLGILTVGVLVGTVGFYVADVKLSEDEESEHESGGGLFGGDNGDNQGTAVPVDTSIGVYSE